MANQVPKVKRGQKFSFRAEHWNAFADAANAHVARQFGRPGGELRFGASAITVPVKNASYADRNRFAVLGIEDVLFDPTDDEDAFLREPFAFEGRTPDEDKHAGQFVILAEPIAGQKIGRAYIQGLTPVKIEVTDEAHTYADVLDGSVAKLASRQHGAARVLWKQPGVGERWAVVLLGVAPWRPADPAEYEVLQAQGTGEGVKEVWDFVRMHGNPPS